MKVVCPCCQTDFPIDAGLLDGDGKRLALILAEAEPALARSVIRYLALHKPAKQALRLARAAKLAEEVITLAMAPEVRRGGASRPNRAEFWTQAIEQMTENRSKLRLPLSGHGYVTEVAFGLAEQAEAREEARAEEAKRTGGHRRTAPGGRTEAETTRDREIAWVHQIHGYGQIDDAERDRRLAEIAAKYKEGA